MSATPAEVDAALTYLEADVYEFRSGYERARVARRLAGMDMSAEQQARARRYVLDVVDGRKHCEQRAVGQLAHAVADNPTRAALRARLHADDVHIARRAVRTLSRVRRPALSEADAAVARALVLADAELTPWLPPNVDRLARWLWTADWENELRALTSHHGTQRASAKKIVESIDRRRAAKRPDP